MPCGSCYKRPPSAIVRYLPGNQASREICPRTPAAADRSAASGRSAVRGSSTGRASLGREGSSGRRWHASPGREGSSGRRWRTSPGRETACGRGLSAAHPAHASRIRRRVQSGSGLIRPRASRPMPVNVPLSRLQPGQRHIHLGGRRWGQPPTASSSASSGRPAESAEVSRCRAGRKPLSATSRPSAATPVMTASAGR